MTDLASNRRATYDYAILDTFEAGISLLGTEVKSLRNQGGNLQGTYVLVDLQNDVWLKYCSIAPYKFGVTFTHEEKRDRKLLLHKREIEKLKKASEEKGLTLIPLSMYLKNGRVKVKIGIAKGKKAYDKRAAIKERDVKRSMSRKEEE